MPARLSRHAPLVAVCIVAGIFAFAYISLDFNRLYALRVGSNTGSYLQAVLNVAAHGSSFNYGDWHPELRVHDQWMMLVLLPFALLYPHAQTVIVVQVLSLALAAPVAYVVLRRLGAQPVGAAAVAVAFLITPSMQGFAYNEFVPIDFVPLLALGLAAAVLARSLPWIVILTTLLCGTKEDVALFTLWIALWYAVFRDRKTGATVVVTAAVQLAIYFAIERIAGGRTIHPSYGLSDPFWRQNLAFTAEMLAPFAFAPLALGWRMALAVPLMAELFLAQGWAFPLGQAGNYYTIPFVTVVALGAFVVLARRPRWSQITLGCAFLMALLFNTTVVHFGRHPFPVDPQYAIAKAWGETNAPVEFPCEDQGAWVVAASDPQAKLLGCEAQGAGSSRSRGAWSNEPLASDAPWTRGPSISR